MSTLGNGFLYNYPITPKQMNKISLGNSVKMVKLFR